MWITIFEAEAGVQDPQSRRPVRWRSLAVRVLGVVAAGVACLVEGRATPVSGPLSSVPDNAGSARSIGGTMREPLDSSGFPPKVFVPQHKDGGQGDTNAPHEITKRNLQAPLENPRLASAIPETGFGFLDTLVHSSIWMSACLSTLVPYVQASSGSSIDWRPFWAGFFESLVVYTVDHLRDNQKIAAMSGRSKTGGLKTYILKVLSLVGLAGFTGSVIAAPVGRHVVVALTFGLHLLLCVAYAKLKPRLPYFKAAYVSLCVVFMAIAAPAAYEPSLLSGFSLAALARLILLIMSISFTIENLQDLRDIKEDKEHGVVTLPSGLGVAWTCRLLVASQAACVLLQVCLDLTGVLPLRAEMLAIHCICAACAMGFRETTSPYLFQVILEPLYVSPVALLFVRAVTTGS